MPTEQLRVARLTKPHGLKGAIKLELHTDDPGRRLAPGAVLFLRPGKSSAWAGGDTVQVRELRYYNEQPVVFLVEVEDRSAAEQLVPAELWIDQPESELSDEPDAWYDYQLIGLSVLRDGDRIGTLVRVEHLPAQDLLVVETERGEVLVPFVTAIVPEVDLDAGTITLTPPPGLFEETPEAAPDEAAAETPDEPAR